MKEIVIRYKTLAEIDSSREHSIFEVLVDGVPIPNLKRFQIDLDVANLDNSYTINQYMDYPNEPEYHDR